MLAAQNRFSLVISEIMADPAPPVGLPNTEWIELHNISAVAVNLSGWRIADASGTSGAMPAFVLKPDSSIVICAAASVAALSVFGSTIAVTSFPSLDNTGEQLQLKAPNGSTIHVVEYSIDWFNNAVKAAGGWTLEMIDPQNVCGGAGNWAASTNAAGGTPGKTNSVKRSNPDEAPPQLLRGFATSGQNITLLFNEFMDSLSMVNTAAYTISDGFGRPLAAVAPAFDRVQLTTNATLQPNKVYTISATGIKDCAGNGIGSFNTVQIGLPTTPDSRDVVVNELLFEPMPNSCDYLELYNCSNKVIDLKNLLIAGRNGAGVIQNIRNISADNYLLLPGAYLVLAEDPAGVKRQYTVKNSDALLPLQLPSLPNDKGNIVLLTSAGKILDELAYDVKWHFPLITNTAGVALERLDAHKPTQDKNNWSSAAATAGFGTPTYLNSQQHPQNTVNGAVSIQPAMFSPDNDGHDDIAWINLNLPAPGYVVNITIFDAAGRPVRALQRNATAGTTASFRWDGLDDKQQKLPPGNYVALTEVFNLQGKTKQFRNMVTLAVQFK